MLNQRLQKQKTELENKTEDKEMREQLVWVARISNGHRSGGNFNTSTNSLVQFEKEIGEMDLSNITGNYIKKPLSLKPIFERFIQLATVGTTKQLMKKHGDGLARYYAKLHFSASKLGGTHHSAHGKAEGGYGMKHSVHLRPYEETDVRQFSLSSSMLHEAIHYEIAEGNKTATATPEPKAKWQKLSNELKMRWVTKKN